jgi:hypothetical protein
VLGDPDQRRQYVFYMHAHAYVEESEQEHVAQSDGREAAGLMSPDGDVHRPAISVYRSSLMESVTGSPILAYAISLLVAAAALWGAGFWKSSPGLDDLLAGRPAGQSLMPVQPAKARGVAFQVTKAIDCRWVDPQAAAADAAKGNFRFLSGTLEIVHECGATVVLEGPCNYLVTDNNAGCLFVGKLTATVPETCDPRPRGRDERKGILTLELRGKGGGASFIVYTRGGALASRGGVFQVQVDERDVSAATFRGNVIMRPAPGGMFRRIPVVAGDTPTASADGKGGG